MEKIRARLGASKLDFLFIDGDHAYEGVKRDWEMYSCLVRSGGIVAFHDIVPDHGSRLGIRTTHDAGGVHQLWNEIKYRFPYKEFVENRAQNGYGIGVLTL
jgi:predicted O-methyltransferase YrrM